MEREKLGSRLGFILLSAGCAIGCGNVWKFPWLCGQNGGGAFVVLYLLFLLILGLPVMTMEFAVGRASQASPVRIYHNLVPDKKAWRAHGYASLIGNTILMMFYTSVAGWILYYFIKFLKGDMMGVSSDVAAGEFGNMLSDTTVMIVFMAIVVVMGFAILSFGLQKGLERVTKYMMLALFALMIVLCFNSALLPGAREGISFYIKPVFSKINGSVVVAAMNQAFFTLSLGIGAMAIFGSYIGKERALFGESVNVIALDTLVALMAGLIIFPACFTYDIEPGAGPSLLFVAMSKVFNSMAGGRIWGTLFFLFMFFAAMSTVLAVFENILACVMEMTNWKRLKTAVICCIVILILSLPCALGYNVLANLHPFNSDSAILDLEDFIVSNCLLPLGSAVVVIFCVSKKGWGFENFLKEANEGKGMKFPKWIKGYVTWVLPLIIFAVFIIGVLQFPFADNFTILDWLKSL